MFDLFDDDDNDHIVRREIKKDWIPRLHHSIVRQEKLSSIESKGLWLEYKRGNLPEKINLSDISQPQEEIEEELELYRQDKENDERNLHEIYDAKTLSNYETILSPRNRLIPPKHHDWEPWHGQSQMLCCLCLQPALSASIPCRKCNQIVHVLCLRKQMTSRKEKKKPNEEFICADCKEQLDEDIPYFHRKIKEIKRNRLEMMCASIIIRGAKRYLEKKRRRKIKHSIKVLQGFFSSIILNKRFRAYLRRKPVVAIMKFHNTPVSISSSTLPVIPNSSFYYFITVYDNIKNAQIYRFTRKSDEEFLTTGVFLPGVIQSMSIIITYTYTTETLKEKNNFFILGQAKFSLRDLNSSFSKKKITLNYFRNNNTIIPQAGIGFRNFNFTLLNPLDSNPLYESVVDYRPGNPCFSVCSYVVGPPLEVLRKVPEPYMKKLKENDRTIPSTIPNSSIFASTISSTPPTSSSSSTISLPNISKKNSSSISSSPKLNRTESLLKKSKSNNSTLRTSRYWLCFHHGRLFLYQYQGDSLPRFNTNILDCVTINHYTIYSSNARNNLNSAASSAKRKKYNYKANNLFNNLTSKANSSQFSSLFLNEFAADEAQLSDNSSSKSINTVVVSLPHYNLSWSFQFFSINEALLFESAIMACKKGIDVKNKPVVLDDMTFGITPAF